MTMQAAERVHHVIRPRPTGSLVALVGGAMAGVTLWAIGLGAAGAAAATLGFGGFVALTASRPQAIVTSERVYVERLGARTEIPLREVESVRVTADWLVGPVLEIEGAGVTLRLADAERAPAAAARIRELAAISQAGAEAQRIASEHRARPMTATAAALDFGARRIVDIHPPAERTRASGRRL